MNFFEHQDQARSSTRKLVVLFALAVVSLIFITTFLVVFILTASQSATENPSFSVDLVTSDIFVLVSLGVLAVVLLGTLFRTAQLRGGGRVVAESLGGRLLNMQTQDADERKILNVVEEMAIASGIPVPQVYLMEDQAINAFAAGYKQEDAVIGVTRGCIHLLDRDELQGVIAHEFSHIFNGDMRLNIRLMGWLYGIMVIGMIGYFILRSNMYRGISRGKNNKGGIVFLGLGLVVIGYGGTFFGNIIKAAVSRQREFLADASAVQYTRNPEGISGALKKIGASSYGSLLTSVDASEVSHLLFGQGIKAGFSGMFATHPPLQDRIKRLDAQWDGTFEALEPKPDTSQQAASAGASTGRGAGLSGPQMLAGIMASIGDPRGEHLQRAQALLTAIPVYLQEEAHNTLGACLLMHSLVIANSDVSALDKQLKMLEQQLSPASLQDCKTTLKHVRKLPRQFYLPLLEMSIPSLKQLSEPQCSSFLKDLYALIEADKHFSLFEWCMFKMLHACLVVQNDSGFRQQSLEASSDALASLLSVLAYAGETENSELEAAFEAANKELGLNTPLNLKAKEDCQLDDLNKAVEKLQSLKVLQKPRLLKAMLACIVNDSVLTLEEGELFRALGSILDCPLPPLPDLANTNPSA